MFFFLWEELRLAADPVTLLLFGALAGACAAWWGHGFLSRSRAGARLCGRLARGGLSPSRSSPLCSAARTAFPRPPDDMPYRIREAAWEATLFRIDRGRRL